MLPSSVQGDIYSASCKGMAAIQYSVLCRKPLLLRGEDWLEFHAFEEILDTVQPGMVLGTMLAVIFQAGIQLA